METPPATSFTHALRNTRQVRLLYFVLAVGMAAAFALVAISLVLRNGRGEVSLPPGPGPAAVSEAQLKEVAAKTDHKVYWAGAESGAYELTRTTDGRIYVRYLPAAARVGDPSAKYLTVGTYPAKNAFRSIERAAHRPGAVSVKLADNGLLVFNASAPKSVYFGYPGANYQVEVYDPSPAQARTLVLNGTVKPIG
jgi:hypothetical protein